MERIAIDMDDVMADTSQRKIDWYERDFGIKINKADIEGKYVTHYVPKEHYEHVRAYSKHKDFFWDLKVAPESQRVIEALTEKYEVFIVTAAMPFPNSYNAKYEWLRQYFPFIDIRNVVYCGHKYIIDADYLIDDHAYNLESFNGKGILFTAPHNTNETRFERVDNWFDVEQIFL
jgi:5'(3')-deoxyribonucleotidase